MPLLNFLICALRLITIYCVFFCAFVVSFVLQCIFSEIFYLASCFGSLLGYFLYCVLRISFISFIH